MTEAEFNCFCELLKGPCLPWVFNPWFDYDRYNDKDIHSPEKRRNNLYTYLKERENARFLLLAEALGYQGGHFSGIAMTSERMILGHMAHKGILPSHISGSTLPERTSRETLRPLGFTEPTATIVWGRIIDLGFNPKDFILWNAFPWHPYKKGDKSMLSNRTPLNDELPLGIPALKYLIAKFDFGKILAIGRTAQSQLIGLGINSPQLRHPSNGGAGIFRQQLKTETGCQVELI